MLLQQSFNPALEPSTLTFGKGENIGNLQLQILNLHPDLARWCCFRHGNFSTAEWLRPSEALFLCKTMQAPSFSPKTSGNSASFGILWFDWKLKTCHDCLRFSQNQAISMFKAYPGAWASWAKSPAKCEKFSPVPHWISAGCWLHYLNCTCGNCEASHQQLGA